MVGNAELDGRFGVAIGISGADGAFFGDGYHVGKAGCVAVDGGGGGENNIGDVVPGHGAKEADGSVDIDTVVFKRNFPRLTHCLLREVWLS